MASNTGCRSPGELEMTRSTSEVAVCCSSASASSRVRASSCFFNSFNELGPLLTRALAFVLFERMRPRVALFAPLRDKVTSSARSLVLFQSASHGSSLSILTEPHDKLAPPITRSPHRRGRAERYPQIFGWPHDPRAYLFSYTLDRTSPLPRSSQEARIPGQRQLVQSPPIPRHPEVLRRHRRANCCPHAIRSVEPYQGHYRHTLCATFPRRQSREWRTRTQCEPGRAFDF